MIWKENTSESSHRPKDYRYYTCEEGGLALTLNPPYKTGPWTVYLTGADGATVNKEVFRLREGKEDPVKDLDKAKTKAVDIMEDFILGHVKHWADMYGTLGRMKARPIPDDAISAVGSMAKKFTEADMEYKAQKKAFTDMVQKLKEKKPDDPAYLLYIAESIKDFSLHEYSKILNAMDLRETEAAGLPESDVDALNAAGSLFLDQKKKRERIEKELTGFLEAYMEENGVWDDKVKLEALISITPAVFFRFTMFERLCMMEKGEGT